MIDSLAMASFESPAFPSIESSATITSDQFRRPPRVQLSPAEWTRVGPEGGSRASIVDVRGGGRRLALIRRPGPPATVDVRWVGPSAIPFCRASPLDLTLILHPDWNYHRALTDQVSERKSSMIPGRGNIENRQPHRNVTPRTPTASLRRRRAGYRNRTRKRP